MSFSKSMGHLFKFKGQILTDHFMTNFFLKHQEFKIGRIKQCHWINI